MTTKLNETPTQAEEAKRILELFNEPRDFTVGRAQKAISTALNDAASYPNHTTLDDVDIYSFYAMRQALYEMEEYFERYPSKGKLMNELYKHGLTLSELDELYKYVCHKLVPKNDFNFEGTVKKIAMLIQALKK
jgi:hypothetical protein